MNQPPSEHEPIHPQLPDFERKPHRVTLQKIDAKTHEDLSSSYEGILQLNLHSGSTCYLVKNYVSSREPDSPFFTRALETQRVVQTSSIKDIYPQTPSTWIITTVSGSCYKLQIDEPYIQEPIEPETVPQPASIMGRVRNFVERTLGGKGS